MIYQDIENLQFNHNIYQNITKLLLAKKTEIQQNTPLYFHFCEKLMAKHDYVRACCCWLFYHEFIDKTHFAVICRIFDALISNYEIEKARIFLNKIEEIDRNHEWYINRKDIFLTKQSDNWRITLQADNRIYIYENENSQIRTTIFYKKANFLTNFCIKISTKNINNTHRIKYVLKSRFCDNTCIEKIIDCNIIERSNFEILFNALSFSSIIFYDDSENEIGKVHVYATKIFKVLQGYNNYLFLDNDTNNSVSQFVGDKLISEDNSLLWSNFLNEFSNSNNALVVISPSKESVFSDFYPFKRGMYTY